MEEYKKMNINIGYKIRELYFEEIEIMDLIDLISHFLMLILVLLYYCSKWFKEIEPFYELANHLYHQERIEVLLIQLVMTCNYEFHAKTIAFLENVVLKSFV